jgi:alpha-L-rhamnosidase
MGERKQVLAAVPLPPYKQTPWKRYVESDVTGSVRPGRNVLALEVTLYDIAEGGQENHSQTPMSACLYIEKQDGSVEVLTSSTNWKAELNAAGEWQRVGFDDESWPIPVPAEAGGAMGDSGGGRPWPTGPVKMLRREIRARNGVQSVRLYATALGAYRFWRADW